MIKKNQEYSLPHHNLSDKQKDKADIELKKLRFERLKNIGAEQKIYSDLISLKYNIIDYLELGLFSEKSEVTITHQSTDDLRAKLRQKLEKLVNPPSDIEEAVIIDGDIIDVDVELGLSQPEEALKVEYDDE